MPISSTKTVSAARAALVAVALALSAGSAPAMCGDGMPDVGEECDLGIDNGSAGACCTADCEFRAADEVCRPAAGACDVADVCTGGDALCPVAPGANVAPAGVATQISDLGADTQAGLAIDGNTNGHFGSGSVTHTSGGPTDERWWMVDLTTAVSIAEVRLWNRNDCCSDRLRDFYVLVSDDPFASDVLADNLVQAGVSAYYHAGQAGSPSAIEIGREGRYVRVVTNGTGELSIAEAEVLVTSDPKHAADTVCRAAAGDCDIAEVCDGLTDACPDDEVVEDGALCHEPEGTCDTALYCDGMATDCSDPVFLPAGTPCADGESECAYTGTCPGDAAACVVTTPSEGLSCGLGSDRPCSSGICDNTEGYAFVGFTGAAASYRRMGARIFSWTFQPTGAPSPTIDYDEGAGGAGMVAVGDGEVAVDHLQIIHQNGFDSLGAVWHDEMQPVAGGFDTTYHYNLFLPSAAVWGDGYAFVIQRTPFGVEALGDGGEAMGFGGLEKSVAVVLDLRNDLQGYEPTVSIRTRYAEPNSPAAEHTLASGPAGMVNFYLFSIRVLYTPGAPGTLAVFLNGSETALLEVPFDMDDLDLTGTVCTGPSAPRTTCAAAPSAVLNLSKGEKTKLLAKWTKAGSIAKEDLSDPTDETDYALCVYDDDGLDFSSRIRAGGECGPREKDCWKETGKGYKFKDPSADRGIKTVVLKGSAKGKATAVVSGGGEDLELPEGTFSGPVTAQVANLDTGTCFSATFSGDAVKENSAAKFRATLK